MKENRRLNWILDKEKHEVIVSDDENSVKIILSDDMGTITHVRDNPCVTIKINPGKAAQFEFSELGKYYTECTLAHGIRKE